MPRSSGGPAAAFFWIACGFAALSTLPFVQRSERISFAASEPYHVSPVPLDARGIAYIRNDEIGKGHFAASRNNNRTHKGIDLSAPMGAPLFATKSGRVSVAEYDKGYGNWVELRHPDGMATRYAHMTALAVRKGDWVARGQVVGTCGRSGNADDPRVIPHVHYEIRYGEHALNPTQKLLDPALTLKNT